MLSFLSWKKTICHSIVLSLPSLRQHNQHHHYHHHHHLASWCEASWVSLAEYCEKLQQRRSRVARLCLCENFFKAGYSPATLVEDNKEKWVDKGVDKGHMKRDLGMKKKVDCKFDFAFTSWDIDFLASFHSQLQLTRVTRKSGPQKIR